VITQNLLICTCLYLCSSSSFTDINFTEARVKVQGVSLSYSSSPVISPLEDWIIHLVDPILLQSVVVYPILQCFHFYHRNEQKSSLTDLEVAGRIVYMNRKGIVLKAWKIFR
jgi:hypothetical protein